VTPPTSGGGGGGSGGGGIDVCSDEGGRAVAIVLPTPASDPNVDALVTNPNLSVECAVMATDALVGDSSPAGRCASATVMTFLDLGPSVVILAPNDGSVQAGGMDVEFTIMADPVSD